MNNENSSNNNCRNVKKKNYNCNHTSTFFNLNYSAGAHIFLTNLGEMTSVMEALLASIVNEAPATAKPF